MRKGISFYLSLIVTCGLTLFPNGTRAVYASHSTEFNDRYGLNSGSIALTDPLFKNLFAITAAPTISNITNKNTDEDTPTGAITFTVGDAETPAGDLIVSGSSSNTSLIPNGSIAFGGSGADRTVTISPASNQSGSATITVSVTDGNNESSSDTFILTVNPVNDQPIISDITNKSTDEDTPTSAIPFTVDDIESNNASLSLSKNSSNTSLVPNNNIKFGGSGSARNVTITPALNQSGTTTITVTVSDGDGGSANDSFLLTVNSVNDLPTISDIPNQSTGEDTSTDPIPFTVGDVDNSAGSLNVSGTSSNTSIVPNTNITFGGSGSSRTVSITPALNQIGTTNITVTVSDGEGGFANDSFILTVNFVNDLPTISDITNKNINEDSSTGSIPFTIGDSETAVANLSVSGTSSNTSLVPNANITFGGSGSSRTVSITPALNQTGSTTIAVTVTDGDGGSANDSFLLTVAAVNDPPTISDIPNQSTGEDTSTGPIPFTVGDVDNSAGILNMSATSSNTSLVPNGNISFGGSGSARTVTVSPALNQSGSSTITLTVTDGGGGSANDTFLLTVNPIADPPTISDIPDQLTDEDTPTSAIPFNVSDAETLAASLIVSVASSDITLVPNTNITLDGIAEARTITVSPAPDQFGSTIITVTVTDGDGGSAIDTFLFTVNSINDPPIALGDFYEIAHSQALNVSSPGILLNDTDVDGDTLIPFEVEGQGPFHGSLNLRNNGSFVYDPDNGYTGIDTFQYYVTDVIPDGSFLSNIAQVSINIFDADSPRISWMEPVTNGAQYEVNCEDISLEVEAVDDLLVDQVHLSYFDYQLGYDIPIKTFYSPPYQTTFNTCILNPEFNQINAVAYDSSGNDSGYPAFIWLYHYAFTIYLPTLGK